MRQKRRVKKNKSERQSRKSDRKKWAQTKRDPKGKKE